MTPTQNGKTTLGFELLDYCATPELPAHILVTKPEDKTVRKLMRTRDYVTIRDWPPPVQYRLGWQKPPGYVIWPKFTMNMEQDDAHVEQVMKRAILLPYKAGRRRNFGRTPGKQCIIMADETYSLSKEYNLDRPMITILSKGGGMGVGIWGFTQKPSHIPLWFYSMPTHLFLGMEPDKRSRARFAEIGGVDPELVSYITMRLPKFHYLYICRNGPTMCIVGP
jgi:hypothetical protein